MHKLSVDERLLGTLIADVAPRVSDLTRWDLRLPFLRFRVIARDRAYEEIMLGRVRGAGIVLGESPERSLPEKLMEYWVEASCLAAYEPGRGEILVVRENVDDGNIDGLKLVLTHELVHRGQHVRFPEVFANIDEIVRLCWYANLTHRMPSRKELAQLERSMTILESHAFFVQQVLAKNVFPNARIEQSVNPLQYLLRFLGIGKSSQYTAGLPRVAEASSRGTVDEMYRGLTL